MKSWVSTQPTEVPNCVPFQSCQLGFVTDRVAQCDNMLSIEMSRLDLASERDG
jgi:hypothetical protein